MRPPVKRRIRLLIAYDGTDFSGWQRQKNDRTIQGEIERCLTTMAREAISLHGAGRTDSGVHADAMVAHFDCSTFISDLDFQQSLNSMLPEAIRIHNVTTCASDFHSRFSATGKRYQYSIFSGKVQPPHTRLYSLHVTSTLNIPTITKCLTVLQGTHDFSSFENSGSRDKTATGGRGAVRTIFSADLQQGTDQLLFEFKGDGFLRNMVRNIVGTILEAGRGKFDEEVFQSILNAKNRSKGGPTAPPQGLFLKEVYYNENPTETTLAQEL
jgi:tRNA pseudouridine38-40 synthase